METRKELIIVYVGSILIIIWAIAAYCVMDDLGIWDGSYQHSTLAKVTSYIGACFTIVHLWFLWEKFMYFVRKVICWLIIIFIISGICAILQVDKFISQLFSFF